MKIVALLMTLFFAGVLHAEDAIETTAPDRDPANMNMISASKRTYPGGGDEEDLLVQNHLPEAALKTDARTLQRGVYKTLYNQEMKDERTENVEE
jgi:hypothetical protein